MTTLQAMGCTMAQGPFMGSAVSGESVDGLLAAVPQTPEASSTALTQSPPLPQ